MPSEIDTRLYWFHIGKYWKDAQEDDRLVQVFRAKRIIVHPFYDFDEDRNDIALVELDGFVLDIRNIRPICLPSGQLSPFFRSAEEPEWKDVRPRQGERCVATGWGSTKMPDINGNKLQEIILPVTKPETCVRKPFDFRNVICAGGIISQDTCKGDSGGPLTCKRNGVWYLDGVTSFGEGCGLGTPGGYTRVNNYMTWMRRYVGDKCGIPR